MVSLQLFFPLNIIASGLTVSPRKYLAGSGITVLIPVKAIYNENSSLEDTDREVMATPLAITRFTTMWGMKMLAAGQPERFEALEKVGFKLDRELDLWKCLSKRNGGHYMDVGASKKIADGLVGGFPRSRGHLLTSVFAKTTDQNEERCCACQLR